jgi:hypothetical protein
MLVYAARYSGGSSAVYTLANPIRVAGSGYNLIQTGDSGLTLSGPLTLAGDVVVAPNENYTGVTAFTISGGVSGTEDVVRLAEMAKAYPNLVGAIVGKALYEGRCDVAGLLKATGER